ncbi:MAG: 3-isopropylmalate dehydrogenase [Burkholderiaceae bacterium]|nr:3-isopropylmalate dehydrogenase [Burkholderiaceae bacterium]MBP7660817.1 3-isopropylmalate dehydrogenase [Burkholderiaceae bacterium]
MKVAVLPGDGIGPEITAQAVRVLKALANQGVAIELESAPVGGTAFDLSGDPLPAATIAVCESADAILFGSVGGPQYDTLPRAQRPEQGLLRLRKHFDLFANLRPAIVYPELAHASTLKPEVVAGLDLLILRELTGDIYFGQPRGVRTNEAGEREGFDTMRYTESEIRRIAHTAFQAARKRSGRVCSVDKANVLETTQFWRDVVTDVHKEYTDIALSHMYVDNAAMQLIRNPKQFDVIVTGNMFGDILSDEASMLTGSIGMLPSASLNAKGFGLYEPIHGSAPDIAGKGLANPLATILSTAMMLRYSLNQPAAADRVEAAVRKVLAQGLRTADIAESGRPTVGTQAMGDAVLAALG